MSPKLQLRQFWCCLRHCCVCTSSRFVWCLCCGLVFLRPACRASCALTFEPWRQRGQRGLCWRRGQRSTWSHSGQEDYSLKWENSENWKMKNENCTISTRKGNSYCRRKRSAMGLGLKSNLKDYHQLSISVVTDSWESLLQVTTKKKQLPAYPNPLTRRCLNKGVRSLPILL